MLTVAQPDTAPVFLLILGRWGLSPRSERLAIAEQSGSKGKYEARRLTLVIQS